MRSVFPKRPADTLDFDACFRLFLDKTGDTLASAVVSISGGTATIAHHQVFPTSVKVWVEGGADGETNEVEVIATTAGGRVKDTHFSVRVRED